LEHKEAGQVNAERLIRAIQRSACSQMSEHGFQVPSRGRDIAEFQRCSGQPGGRLGRQGGLL
jgi:hypothetical protein